MVQIRWIVYVWGFAVIDFLARVLIGSDIGKNGGAFVFWIKVKDEGFGKSGGAFIAQAWNYGGEGEKE